MVKTSIVLIVISVISFAQQEAKLPGVRDTVKSPDGRFLLINVDRGGDEPNHSLYLRDLSKKTETKLLDYRRAVYVLWSPGSRAFAVNDHAASDLSNSYIYLLQPQIQKIDIGEKLRNQYGQDPRLSKNHHLYIEITRWAGNSEVVVKVTGYGDVDPMGFTSWYLYNLKETTFKPRKTRGEH